MDSHLMDEEWQFSRRASASLDVSSIQFSSEITLVKFVKGTRFFCKEERIVLCVKEFECGNSFWPNRIISPQMSSPGNPVLRKDTNPGYCCLHKFPRGIN